MADPSTSSGPWYQVATHLVTRYGELGVVNSLLADLSNPRLGQRKRVNQLLILLQLAASQPDVQTALEIFVEITKRLQATPIPLIHIGDREHD